MKKMKPEMVYIRIEEVPDGAGFYISLFDTNAHEVFDVVEKALKEHCKE